MKSVYLNEESFSPEMVESVAKGVILADRLSRRLSRTRKPRAIPHFKRLLLLNSSVR